MPTFETLPRFTADLQHLTPAQRWRFRRVVLESFVPDLRTGRLFRPGLRVKGGAERSRGLRAHPGTGRARHVVRGGERHRHPRDSHRA
ncbi:hypothetical protein OG749_45765 [Streptomyces nojiriensis]|uniref:hypothetical protein n=1 Tax=Streptomyces nojiriensis TaxID=66374 RepID=UPI002E16D0DE